MVPGGTIFCDQSANAKENRALEIGISVYPTLDTFGTQQRKPTRSVSSLWKVFATCEQRIWFLISA